MAIEGATHINDLDVAKPSGTTEQVLDLDNYHRQIKEVLKRDVNNFAGTALVYGADAASTDDYAFSSALTITTYTAGIICLLDLTGGNTNTGAARLNIDGIGLKAIVGLTGAALAAGALQIGINLLVYNGTSFVLGASPIVDINGGTIDGTVIGASVAAAITGTTIAGTVITASTSIATAAGATITDIDTAMDATPTDGQLLTSQGISEYVAARVFTGAAHTTYLAGESWSDAHGKGTVPDLIQAYAVKNATGTDGGYTSGQKIVLTVVNSGDALDKGFNVWADTTNLYGSVHDGANLIAYSTAGANFNMTALEWDIYLVGVWFS